jgi:Concanavalin A-like lectin/glucanases superfamily
MDTLGLVHFGVNPLADTRPFNVVSGSRPLNDGQWHLVAGVLSSAGEVLYVDGDKAGEDPGVTSAQNYSKGYWKLGFDFRFWDWPYPPRDLYFKGALDEARVSTRALSKEWMRLSYQSQRPDSRFLRFDER